MNILTFMYKYYPQFEAKERRKRQKEGLKKRLKTLAKKRRTRERIKQKEAKVRQKEKEALKSEEERIDHYFNKRWQIKREVIIKRDKGKCQICGQAGVDVHHKIPIDIKAELQFKSSNLILLCLKCHRQQHPELPKALFKKRYGIK